MIIRNFISMALCTLFFACSAENEDVPDESEGDGVTMENPIEEPPGNTPNILLVIADDMGLDASPGYDIGNLKPDMPNLQAMMANGITFDNVWSYPTCTPTRASVLTGTHGIRTNVLKVGDELATSELSIQRYLDENVAGGYSTALVGKWHLSRDTNQPIAMGIDYFAGILGGGVDDYYNWSLVENGTTGNSTEYATTKLTDLAIDWVADQSQPWFLWLAYNAPHVPFHLPPSGLHSQGDLPTDQASIDANPLPYYLAAIEAMDSEIGRLLTSLSQEERDNTLIIFIGDNGTPNQVRQEYANRRVKGTVYQGGVNVPMVVSGAYVDRFNQREEALIETTDLFSTIADVAGAGDVEINDSNSFRGLLDANQTDDRTFIYSEIEQDSGNSDYTIRNETHKYIRFNDGEEALYDLINDPLEVMNLLNESPLSDTDAMQYDNLTAEVTIIRQ